MVSEWLRTPPSYYDAVRSRHSLSQPPPMPPDQLKYNSLPRPLPQRPAEYGRQQYDAPPKPANRVPLPLQLMAPPKIQKCPSRQQLSPQSPPDGWKGSLPRGLNGVHPNGGVQRGGYPRVPPPAGAPRYSKGGTFQPPPPAVQLRTGPLGSYPDAETLANAHETIAKVQQLYMEGLNQTQVEIPPPMLRLDPHKQRPASYHHDLPYSKDAPPPQSPSHNFNGYSNGTTRHDGYFTQLIPPPVEPGAMPPMRLPLRSQTLPGRGHHREANPLYANHQPTNNRRSPVVVKPTPRHPPFQSVINELSARHHATPRTPPQHNGVPALSLSLSSLCSDASSRIEPPWDSFDKKTMASPWDREEKEKVAREAACASREEAILRLESLPSRSARQSEWLRLLRLERDFQRRAQQEMNSSDESASSDDEHALDVFHPVTVIPAEKHFMPLGTPSDDDDGGVVPVPAPRPSKKEDSSSLSQLQLPDYDDEWIGEQQSAPRPKEEEGQVVYANLVQPPKSPRKPFPAMGISRLVCSKSAPPPPPPPNDELSKLWIARPEKLTFQDKIRKFSLQAGEDDAPRDRVKNSRKQREIESTFVA